MGEDIQKDELRLLVVGSRAHSPYGERICRELIQNLTGYPIVIISGLALGIDSIAHKAALDAELRTIAFPGSGLSEKVLYPKTNLPLAKEILKNGGTLVSEYEPNTPPAPWTFPKRNRLMAGLADKVLIIEAKERSGTLITARLALDYNKDILVVPGPITSESSIGSNKLLRLGATPILSSDDILDAFGLLEEKEQLPLPFELSKDEETLLAIIEGKSRKELLEEYGPDTLSKLIATLEERDLVKEKNGVFHKASK